MLSTMTSLSSDTSPWMRVRMSALAGSLLNRVMRWRSSGSKAVLSSYATAARAAGACALEKPSLTSAKKANATRLLTSCGVVRKGSHHVHLAHVLCIPPSH